MLPARGGVPNAQDTVTGSPAGAVVVSEQGVLLMWQWSRCRETVWGLVYVQTLGPLLDFLSRTLWEIGSKNGHFYHELRR